uniref:Uncharacterized protein n=1 Tax=Globisporangium ultimum (strain ATCC 200006 / CBS 805.95 / DAOM BR144) TaxID=431595 RepID=K3WP67_GLOUD
MSFVEMITPTNAAAAGANASSSSDASVFTNEEISMIQEMFLHGNGAALAMEPLKIIVDDAMISEKDFQISDISITDGGLGLKADELMLSADDATSVLLSPIGSDATFLNQFLFDEKDAMEAFYLEAIDPFQSSPVKPEETKKAKAVAPRPASPSPIDRASADAEKTLIALRSKVEALTKMYYTRCHRLNGGSEDSAVSVEKVKLVHAIGKLQRIAQGLSKMNAQLVKETTSVTEQSASFMGQMRGELNDAEKIVASINEQACADAIKEATKRAMEFCVAGDTKEIMGWAHKSAINENHTVSYSFEKECKSANTRDIMRKTRECMSSSEQLSRVHCGSAEVQVLKKLSTNAAVVVYDVANKDATRVDRVLAVSYRVELSDNRVLIGLCSMNPLTSSSENMRWMDCSMWQIHESKADGALAIASCGQFAYPSREEAKTMATEIVCSHMKWENHAVGPAFHI